MRHFNCMICGKVYKAKIDGYTFGDRLLEGVMFEVTISPTDGSMTADVPDPDGRQYMDDLNFEKWKKRAIDVAGDAESDEAFSCSVCGEDCYLEEE